MAKNISFALTTKQIRDRTKTVTRRKNWWVDKNNRPLLRVGDVLNACVQCMGLQGKPLERMGQIRVTGLRRETLNLMAINEGYGKEEAAKEGFPNLTGSQFVEMYISHMGGHGGQLVTRIEFEYLENEE